MTVLATRSRFLPEISDFLQYTGFWTYIVGSQEAYLGSLANGRAPYFL